jgi:spermidine synthase
MRRITTETTDHQTLEIWGTAQEVEFRVAGAIQAWWHRERFLTGLAWDNIAAGCLLRPAGPPQRLLMLGLGGGTSLRTLRFLIPNLQITAVELDGGMIRLARKFMELDALNATVHSGDAYAFLLANKLTYDVIVDDVYGSTLLDVIRPTVYTDALAKALNRSLAPGGLFVANLITGAGHRKMQSAFRRFFQATFPVVRSITTPLSLNETLVGGTDVCPPALLQPYRHLWPTRQDRRYWSDLRCRRIQRGR